MLQRLDWKGRYIIIYRIALRINVKMTVQETADALKENASVMQDSKEMTAPQESV